MLKSEDAMDSDDYEADAAQNDGSDVEDNASTPQKEFHEFLKSMRADADSERKEAAKRAKDQEAKEAKQAKEQNDINLKFIAMLDTMVTKV